MYVKQTEISHCAFFSNAKMKLFFGSWKDQKKREVACVLTAGQTSQRSPFGSILNIRNCKNVGHASFTIPPSQPSESVGLK